MCTDSRGREKLTGPTGQCLWLVTGWCARWACLPCCWWSRTWEGPCWDSTAGWTQVAACAPRSALTAECRGLGSLPGNARTSSLPGFGDEAGGLWVLQQAAESPVWARRCPSRVWLCSCWDGGAVLRPSTLCLHTVWPPSVGCPGGELAADSPGSWWWRCGGPGAACAEGCVTHAANVCPAWCARTTVLTAPGGQVSCTSQRPLLQE